MSNSKTVGYLRSVKHELVRFFEAEADKICKNPEEIIEKLIASQGFTTRLLIRGYLKGSNVGTNVKKIEKQLETLKTDPTFINKCKNSKEGEQAEELAHMVMDTMFATPGLTNETMKRKTKYNIWKKNGYKGGKSTRKARKGSSKTYRRRR